MSEKEDLDLEEKTAPSLSPDSLDDQSSIPGSQDPKTVRIGPASVMPSSALPQTIVVEGSDATGEKASKTERTFADGKGISLVRLHAKGAVGEVFIAFDEQLSREIAIKRIRPELQNDKRRVSRFIREAEIAAQLQHPSIVPVYGLSVSDGSPHYSMPLVSGDTFADLINLTHRELGANPTRDQWLLKIRPLLNHFIAVCNAIDYAHIQDVLHRDIKPANIVIGTQGRTLVLDWGCAKRIGGPDTIEDEVDEFGIEDDELAEILGMSSCDAMMTRPGSIMGTLEFMSPEQAAGNSDLIGPPSDIFGLGATLFSLLTNEVAFEYEASDIESVKKALNEVEDGHFRRIDDLDVSVPPALAAICHQAMAVNPSERYKTAGDLGRDIDLFLAGEPVTAFQEPFVGRAARFLKRHRTVFATLVGALLVGFVSLALVTWMINQQRSELSDKNLQLSSLNTQLATSVAHEKELATAAIVRETTGKQQLYSTQMLLASEASSEPGGIGRMRQLVDRWNDPETQAFQGWEWKHLDALGRREIWKPEIGATANQIQFTRNHTSAKVFDSGRSLVLTIDVDGKEILDRVKLPRNVTAFDFNHDQSLMAIGFRNGDVKVIRMGKDKKDAKPVEFLKLKSAVSNVRWNVGGDMLATCDVSGEMAVWQWYDRKIVGTGSDVLDQPDKRLLNWSYDGKQIAWTTGREIRGLTVHSEKEEVLARDNWMVNPCWSHEGELLAYIGPENVIVVTNPKTNETKHLAGHQLFVESLAWHPSEHFLLSASADGTVRIWNVDTKKQVRHLLGHSGHVYSASWSPDGKKVISGGLPEDPLLLWDVSSLGSKAFDRELQNHPAFAWHRDGTQLVVAENSDILWQNDLGESRRIPGDVSSPVEIFGVDLDQTGRQIACVSNTGRVWTVDAESGEILKVFDPGGNNNLFPERTSKSVAWSPDGKFLAGIGTNGRVRVWDLETGKDIEERLPFGGKALVVAWGPASGGKGSLLAYAGTDDNIYIYDVVKKTIENKIKRAGWKTGLAWSPDGSKIAAANRRRVDIWDTESDEQTLVGFCEGPSAMIRDLSWSRSQERIAALTEDGKICIWNAKTFSFNAKFDLHERVPYSIQWSPDGRRLVSTARHGRIVFQDIQSEPASNEN